MTAPVPKQAPVHHTRRVAFVSSALSIASITFWFAISFPWQHHNESLTWAADLGDLSFWGSLLPKPIRHVATYRPLGIAIAWSSFRLTGGGVWLQQLINYAFTVFAWVLALWAARDRLSFAWLSFLCGGFFFAGYIYLFHLHGVFYGPLLVYVAWLLVEDERVQPLSWPTVLRWVGVTVLVGLIHTFAFLLLAAFVVGLAAQRLLAREPGNLVAAAFAVISAGAAIVLLTRDSQETEAVHLWDGFVFSYRSLELNPALGILGVLFAALAAWSLGRGRVQVMCVGAAVVLCLLLGALHMPMLLGWLVACGLKALWLRRFALAGLLAACAALPIATGTGSPTYALFALMPAIYVTVLGLDVSDSVETLQRVLAGVTLIAIPIAAVVVMNASPGGRLAAIGRPLFAEREKTEQLMQMLSWLESNPEVRGVLRLCQPADIPLKGGAIQRRYRAPTDAFSLRHYLQERYGDRFQAGPNQLMLCFGGQILQSATLVHTVPGPWAGNATLERF